MTRLTRKRLSWLLHLAGGSFAFQIWLGPRHFEKWGGHCWKADPADIRDRLRRNP